MLGGVFLLIAFGAAVMGCMYVGYAMAPRLSRGLRVAGALVPLLSLTGIGVFVLILLACEPDTGVPRTCTPSSGAWTGILIGYVAVVLISWVAALISRREPRTQRVWLAISSSVAAIPNILFAGLLIVDAIVRR